MARKAAILKNQVFSITQPDAKKVLLAGDFTDWQERPIPMVKDTDGLWTATVKLSPGQHTYLFIVDGEWCEDPKCSIRVPNPYGGVNMVRQVT